MAERSIRKSFCWRALFRDRSDVVHLQNIQPVMHRAGWRAALDLSLFISRLALLKAAGIRLVWTVHDLSSHRESHAGLERVGTALIAKLANAVITHCERARAAVLTQPFFGNKEKVFVVPHGHYIGYYDNAISRAHARATLTLPQDGFVFLFFGWVVSHKGIVELIDAFERLQSESAYLVISGNAPEAKLTDMLRAKAAENARIRFVNGFIPDDDVQIYMNACDVVVLPYRDVLTSGAVILAMSFARPCVAARRGCLGDVLNDSGAFVYEPDAADGLLGALKQAMEKKNELAAMGHYNQESARHWGWDRVAQDTFAIYRWVINRVRYTHGSPDLNQAGEAQK